MSEGIKLALNYHILPSVKIFKTLVEKNPYHSILHYDLGLSYAKLRKYREAYYHFLRAYHLDSTNYLAGIFAIIVGKKASIKKVNLDRIMMSLNGDIDFTIPKNKIYLALLSLIGNNYSDALSWVETNPKNIKFNLAIELATLYQLGKSDLFSEKSAILKKIAPKDIISNLLYFYSTHSIDNIKKFALDFQPVFLTSLTKWDLRSFYYGSAIAVDLYLKFAKISGELTKVKHHLEKVLLNNSGDLVPVLQNLAFVNLFIKNFEESYTIFNDLIDNKNIKDEKTLFYGAVASIGAGHHSNGIALLSLSKRVNKNEFEARYGLGLLYHEAKNLRGATVQYNLIPTGFESKFFDFEVIP
jgi:tetratricopeptide (TPR) repeat protein